MNPRISQLPIKVTLGLREGSRNKQRLQDPRRLPHASVPPGPGSPGRPCRSRLKGPPPPRQTTPVMREHVLWRCSLTPGATRRRGGGSKAARRDKQHRTPALESNHFIEGLQGKTEKLGGQWHPTSFSEPSARTKAVGEECDVPSGPSLPRRRGSPTQTPVRITRVSSLTRALFGMSSPQAARPPPDSQAPETWQNKHQPTCPARQLLKGKETGLVST